MSAAKPNPDHTVAPFEQEQPAFGAALAAALNSKKNGGTAPPATAAVAAVAPNIPQRRTIAEIRAARTAALSLKVAVNPEITEVLGFLAEEKATLEGNLRKVQEALRGLRAALGVDRSLDGIVQTQITAQEAACAQIQSNLAQIKVDMNGLVSDGGPALALALVARRRVQLEVQKLISEFQGGPTSGRTITTLVDKALDLDALMQGEGGFIWSGRHYASAVLGDPTAFGLVPTVVAAITTLDEAATARRLEAGTWLVANLSERFGDTPRVSFSELLGGGVGYALVPVHGHDQRQMGNLVIVGDGSVVKIIGVTGNPILIIWAIENQRGERAERVVTPNGDGTFSGGHGAIRAALKKHWDAEAPLRAALEAAVATGAELQAFAGAQEGAKVHDLSLSNVHQLLKNSSAGAGLWLIKASWGSPGDKISPRTPFGIALKKSGKGKVVVVYITSTAPSKLEELLNNPSNVTTLHKDLKTILRSACYQLGMRKDYPPEIAKS